MNNKERDEHDALCPQCGAEAQWSYTDSAKSRVEVKCSNCGRFEVSREEFDRAAVESAEVQGPEEN